MSRLDRRPRKARAAANQNKQRVGTAGAILKKVVMRPLESLVVNPSNARKHSQLQLHRLQSCIRTFGFLNPIVIDEAGNIVCGHGRVEAARQLGMRVVPALIVSGLSPAQIRAFTIAENRISDLAAWNEEMLRREFVVLLELQVDIETTAFSTGEVDIILDADPTVPTGADDESLPEAPANPVSRPGDLWQLGPHKLICGDALEGDTYEILLGSLKASVIFTDPPYNVRVDGHVGGLGRIKHREFAMASGEMSTAQFTAFLTRTFSLLSRHSRRGSIHYICMDWRHLREILAAGHDVYSEFKNLCVWNKTNAGMGSFYRSKHELVLVFQNGSGRAQNNVSLGATGRYRTNVWDYPGMNTLHSGRMDGLMLHPTVKPVALVADAIRDCSKRNEVILDPFVGSGTTILAAHRTGRIAMAMEIDPAYVDVAIQRWERATNIPAVHARKGETFSVLGEQRHKQPNDEAVRKGAKNDRR